MVTATHTNVCSRSSRLPLHTVVCGAAGRPRRHGQHPRPRKCRKVAHVCATVTASTPSRIINPLAVTVGYIPRLNLRKCARGWPTVYAVAGGRDFTRPHPCLLSAVGTSAASSMNAVLTAVCRGQLFTFDRFAGCRLHFRACCAVDRVHRRGHPCSMNGQHLQGAPSPR